jgi:trehalose 6-phosphate phosphatase
MRSIAERSSAPMSSATAIFSATLDRAAFFFDFDGTLVELAATPDGISVPPVVPARLAGLRAASGGALAIVTGRALEAIDAFLAMPDLPAAGLHGAERRDAQGRLTYTGLDEARLAELAALAQAHAGLLVEPKRASVAMHYRNAPDCEALVRDAVARIAERHAEHYTLQPGKMVYELKPKGVDKGRAVAAFLGEAPFAGRVPVYAGDDLTDEAAFAVVEAAGGLAIKVGEGETCAGRRAPSVAALGALLDGWLAAGQVQL